MTKKVNKYINHKEAKTQRITVNSRHWNGLWKMGNMKELAQEIFSIKTERDFEKAALSVFRYQYEAVALYAEFCRHLGRTPDVVKSTDQIPFLPIQFFKNNIIVADGHEIDVIFESSGTTASTPSKHYVASGKLYTESFTRCFEQFYGKPSDYVILALLPSYLERGNSSLVFMAKELMEQSGKPENGFFLNEFDSLAQALHELKKRKQRTILLGVTYALLDFAEGHALNFPELIIMETGGMKGRREEMTRAEVHEILCNSFNVPAVHSEYGMTELLSQAYSKGKGIFYTPSQMRVKLRDVYDPLQRVAAGHTGAVDIIDLANLYSCSFIATGDLGRLNTDGSFEILGRTDSAEVRGCNLMYV